MPRDLGDMLKSNLQETYFDIPQAAKEVGVTRQTIYRWINDGKLSVERIGKQVLILKSDLFDMEDLRLVNQIRDNVIRKLRHEAEQYHWLDKDGNDEIVLETIYGGHEGGAYAFELKLGSNGWHKVIISIGDIKVNIDETQPGITVEMTAIECDGKIMGKEFPRWI